MTSYKLVIGDMFRRNLLFPHSTPKMLTSRPSETSATNHKPTQKTEAALVRIPISANVKRQKDTTAERTFKKQLHHTLER